MVHMQPHGLERDMYCSRDPPRLKRARRGSAHVDDRGLRARLTDSFPSAVWTPASPQTCIPAAVVNSVGGLSEFQGAIHAGDPNPVLVTAARDINDLGLAVPKAADIVAGRDIVNLTSRARMWRPQI